MSSHPSPQPNAPLPIRRVTAPQITARKGGDPVVCLTAYDAPTAAILDDHCDLLLVGDSVGMVVHGLPSTVGVTLDMMILHGQAVMRGAHKAFVVVDLPFGSYEDSPQSAFKSASRVMMETGCQGIKIESGSYAAETIAYLVERGIPVMSHVGLRPQSMHVLGGFRARGRTKAVAENIVENAVDFAISEVKVIGTWTAADIQIEILDDGPGFASSVLAKVGEPYISHRPDHSDSAGGLGLGVFIATMLINRIGGDMKVPTRKDQSGARVQMSWPIEHTK